MARLLSDTLADAMLPEAALAEMERLNEAAMPLHIWLRTRANQPLQRAWHEGAMEPVPQPAAADSGAPPGPRRVLPHVWKWTQIEPYLHRIAEIAPLEFTERQQFLLTNPGLQGALRVTNTIRIAISIYKPGDEAPLHLHTPSASRTILSDTGGYSLIEGERCPAGRGDLILTPAGTWHGHGNDDREPVIWMDVLDWPLLEYLDVIWIRHDADTHAVNAAPPRADYSQTLYGAGGMVPRFLPERRGSGQGGTPMFHFKGSVVTSTLGNLRGEKGSVWDGILIEFVNPMSGKPVFPTLTYKAQLLRPGEQTQCFRHTASTVYTVLAGKGYTEVNGQQLAWERNDILVVPANMWRRHVNLDAAADAVLYSLTDEPLLQAIGQYRAQGRTAAGDLVNIAG
jgi:gentisate 1,2-dioxygenase